MKIGALVKHDPENSVVENILRKVSVDTLHPDFSLGIIVDSSKGRSRVYSEALRGLFWYDNSELSTII